MDIKHHQRRRQRIPPQSAESSKNLHGGSVPAKWKSQSSRCIHCQEIAVLLAGRLRIDKHQVDDSKCHRYNKRPWSKTGKDRRCSKPVRDMDGLSGVRLLLCLLFKKPAHISVLSVKSFWSAYCMNTEVSHELVSEGLFC